MNAPPSARQEPTRARSFVSDALLSLLDQLIVSGSNFVTLIYLGRRLEIDEFALFSVAMATTYLLLALHRALFTQPLNLLGATEEPMLLSARSAALLRAHLAAIPLSSVALLIFATAFFPSILLTMSCMAYVACMFLLEMLRRHYFTHTLMRKVLVIDFLCYAVRLPALFVAGGHASLDAASAFWIMAGTAFLPFVFAYRQLRREECQHRRPMRAVLSEQWPLSKWLLLTVAANWCASQSYPFLLTPLGASAIATFAACTNLLNIVNPLAQAISNFVPVHIARIVHAGGVGAMRVPLLMAGLFPAAVGLLLLPAVWQWGDAFVARVYGARYPDAAGVLNWLAVGAVFYLAGMIIGQFSLALHDSRASFFSNMAGAAFTATAGLWLIHRFGLTGAAVASAGSVFASALVQTVFVLRAVLSGTGPPSAAVGLSTSRR